MGQMERLITVYLIFFVTANVGFEFLADATYVGKSFIDALKLSSGIELEDVLRAFDLPVTGLAYKLGDTKVDEDTFTSALTADLGQKKLKFDNIYVGSQGSVSIKSDKLHIHLSHNSQLTFKLGKLGFSEKLAIHPEIETESFKNILNRIGRVKAALKEALDNFQSLSNAHLEELETSGVSSHKDLIGTFNTHIGERKQTLTYVINESNIAVYVSSGSVRAAKITFDGKIMRFTFTGTDT